MLWLKGFCVRIFCVSFLLCNNYIHLLLYLLLLIFEAQTAWWVPQQISLKEKWFVERITTKAFYVIKTLLWAKKGPFVVNEFVFAHHVSKRKKNCQIVQIWKCYDYWKFALKETKKLINSVYKLASYVVFFVHLQLYSWYNW